MALDSFHFLRPLWLLGLIPAAALVAAALRRTAGSNAWRGLVDEHLLRHLLVEGETGTRRWPLWALATAWGATCIALAGPTWERLPQPLFQALDPIVVALDLSHTMEASDLSPSRRMRARYELQDLLDHEPGAQIGLVVFSDEPFVALPLTDDGRVVAELLPSLTANLMPADGDRADRAIAEATALLEQAGAPNGRILLLSDGVGRHAEAAATAAARAASSGHTVSVVGIAAAPALATERPALEAIAAAGGGAYADVRADDADLRRVLARGLAEPAAVREQSAATGDQWRDRGPWVLLIPLLLAPLAFRRGWLVTAALWLALAPGGEAQASLWTDLWQRRDQQAANALDAGRPEAAAELFEDPAWQAAAQYQAGRYQDAAESYERLDGVDGSYNRGNALAHAGDLRGALAAYDEALRVEPGHPDARFNRELVERLLRQQEQSGAPQQAKGSPDAQAQDPENGSGGAAEKQTGEAGGSPAADQSAAAESPSGAGDPTQPEDAGGDAASSEGQPTGKGTRQGDDAPPARNETASAEQDESAAPTAGDAEEMSERNPSETRTAGASDPNQAPGTSPEPRGPHDDAAADDGSLAEGVSQALAAAEPDQAPAPEANQGEPGSPDGAARRGKPLDEESQAREQRLRQIPDDPGGLLRARIYRRYAERRYAQEGLAPW